MKKEIKDRLTEVVSFFICLVILLAIAYYTGFIKGFSVADFQNTYNKMVYDIANSASKSGIRTDLFNTTNANTRRISSYNNYHTMKIPQEVLRGVKSSPTWKNVFYSNKKVVFYIYNDSQISFHNSITNYITTKSKYYNLISYTESSFANLREGDIGPSKICNSWEECNAVRQKAVDYTTLSEFMKRCGEYMCIINPSKQEYVKLNSKNSGQAVKMIYNLKDW